MKVVNCLFILILSISYIISSLHILFLHSLDEHLLLLLLLLHISPGALPHCIYEYSKKKKKIFFYIYYYNILWKIYY